MGDSQVFIGDAQSVDAVSLGLAQDRMQANEQDNEAAGARAQG